MLDGRGSLKVLPPPALPVAEMVVGRPVRTAVDLLPRLFNLCRAAQEVAIELAFGLPCRGTDVTEEIRRDHVMKLFAAWPRAFDLPPRLDRTLLEDDAAALRALFGRAARVPRDDFEMQGFLGSDDGVAPLLKRIAAIFRPGEGCADGLPLVGPRSALEVAAVENSTAARRAAHPALGYVEAFHGRGPLWRAAGRVIDLGLILEHHIPAPRQPRPGVALVPATRGLYAVEAAARDGIVTAFRRITPTDHLLAPGGMLERALASIAPDRAAHAPLLIEILDPCQPVGLEGGRDA